MDDVRAYGHDSGDFWVMWEDLEGLFFAAACRYVAVSNRSALALGLYHRRISLEAATKGMQPEHLALIRSRHNEAGLCYVPVYKNGRCGHVYTDGRLARQKHPHADVRVVDVRIS